jgi:hypothetical protein
VKKTTSIGQPADADKARTIKDRKTDKNQAIEQSHARKTGQGKENRNYVVQQKNLSSRERSLFDVSEVVLWINWRTLFMFLSSSFLWAVG